MHNKMMSVLKSGYLVVPQIILDNMKMLNINLEEAVVISSLLKREVIPLDFELHAKELGMDKLKIMEIIDSLEQRCLLKIEVVSNKDGIKEEIISLELFFDKLMNVILDKEEGKEITTTIYDSFEKEFGRTLSPMEYEIITGWLDADFTESLIICALKEATYNGVSNLRYIDKILYDWNKKGYKNKDDIERSKMQHYNSREKIEVFDYNWLDDE